MQECRGKRPTHAKRTIFTPRERELCSISIFFSRSRTAAGSLCGSERKINLLRYSDSIVDCNRATCSQRVYAKIFI